MEPDIIAYNLQRLRALKRVSLQTVADAVGASKAHVWELETGQRQNPGIKLVSRLARYFGVSVAEFIGEVPLGQGRRRTWRER